MNQDLLTIAKRAIDQGLNVKPCIAAYKNPGIKGYPDLDFWELLEQGKKQNFNFDSLWIEIPNIDLDRKELLEPYSNLVSGISPGLIGKLPIYNTPKGYKIFFNCEDDSSPGQNLAADIEYKGHGVVEGPYSALQGSWLEAPWISPEEKRILIEAAKSFKAPEPEVVELNEVGQGSQERPGDRYNREHAEEALELVLEHSGRILEEVGGRKRIQSPTDKGREISATFDGYYFYNFSTKWKPFDLGEHTPFKVLTYLKHDKDYSKATKALLERWPEMQYKPKVEVLSTEDSEDPTGSTWKDLDKILGPIEWAWDQWLPKGFQVTTASIPGEGKSASILYLAGCYTLGWPWPDNTPFEDDTGHVLWCETESSQALNRDRAKAWKIPLEKIHSPLEDPLSNVSLDSEEDQEAIMYWALRPEIKLIIVDSLSAGTRRNLRWSEETLGVTGFLSEVAKATGKPVITSHHLRKKGMHDGDIISIDRLRDSSAIAQLSRVIWAIDTPDIERQYHKRLYVIKNNLCQFPEPLGFQVHDMGLDFGEAPEEPKQETQLDKAIDLLIARLQGGPVAAKELKEYAEGAALSWITIKRAQKKLRIKKKFDGKAWYWSLEDRDEDILI